MNFIIVTQYYPPVIGGGSQRSVGFVEELNKKGINVYVITPFPSYLMSKEQTKTKFKLYEKTIEKEITVYRTFVYANDRGNFLKRMLYYLSFTFSSTIVILLKLAKIDYVFTVSPPLFTGITGIIVKKLKKVKFIFDIGDLWPESAIQLGFLKNKSAIHMAEWLEKKIYKHSDIINITTRKTFDKVKALHPYIKKLLYIPNFVDCDSLIGKEKNYSIIKKHGLQNKIVVGYAGNIGSAQGLNIMIAAAKLTKNYSNIVYLIIGDGVDKELIEMNILKYNLENVLLLPPVSREEIREYISIFDLVVIPLVKNELFKITIPSKLYESMAAEIPVLICVDGEARRIVEESNCGYYVEPENGNMLAQKILEYSDNRINKELGKNGRKRAEDEFDRKKVIDRFFHELSNE